ncbi:hypothetical protein D3C74_287010 [compost metagenome]
MIQLPGHAQIAGRRLQVASHHVPTDAPAGEVVQRGELPGQRVGLLIGQRAGHRETEILRGRGHGGNLHEGIVQWHLVGIEQGWTAGILVHVIDAKYIGEEQGIKATALQGLGQIHPVFKGVVFVGSILRVPPQPRALVADAGHVKGVKVDALAHYFLFPFAVFVSA